MITYAKLLSAYFSFSQDPGNRDMILEEMVASGRALDSMESMDWKLTESLIELFCQQNFLLAKQMKEVHYLCIQLETMMLDDILVSGSNSTVKRFMTDKFDPPTE